MTNMDPDADPTGSVYKDPFTGTTPVGPLQPDLPGPNRPAGSWSMMARWFMIALIVLGILVVVGRYFYF